MTDQPRHQFFAAGATPEEAVAIAAAYEHFLRDSAPRASPQPDTEPGLWKLAALEEGVTQQPSAGSFAIHDLRRRNGIR